jgi:hypothetical protein
MYERKKEAVGLTQLLTKQGKEMSRKSKRYLIVQSFWRDVAPTTSEDLNVIYQNVNMYQYVQKIFQNASARSLQTLLRHDFPLLHQLFGPPTSTLYHNNKQTSSTSLQPTIYVGLYKFLQQYKQDLEIQTTALQHAIAYARMRQAHPDANVLQKFLITTPSF